MCYFEIFFTGSTDFNSIQQQHTIQPDQVQNTANTNMNVAYNMMRDQQVELVSKELNHLAAILHDYAGGLNFMKYFFLLLFFKKKMEILLHFLSFL